MFINLGETAGCVAQQLNSAALSWCDDRGIRSSVVGRDKVFFSNPKTGSGVERGGGALLGMFSIHDCEPVRSPPADEFEE